MKHKLMLKEVRLRKRLSQSKLAKETNLSQGYLSELESGLKSPTFRVLTEIANVLEVCPKDLICCCCHSCNKEV